MEEICNKKEVDLIREVETFRVQKEFKDQEVMRKMRVEHTTEDGLRFDEGGLMSYFNKNHTSIMMYDCKKCSYLGSNIQDAHKHITKEHKFDFNIRTIDKLIQGEQTTEAEIEAICIPTLLSADKKHIIKLFCPGCKKIKEGGEVKAHLIDYLRTVQGNNANKSKDNQDYNELSTISTIYKVFKEIKELQVVQTTPSLGRKYQRTQ